MIQLYLNLAMLICSGFGFIYGIKRFFLQNKAFYLKLVTMGMGCMMLGRLFIVVSILTTKTVITGFNVGLLGIIGCFGFLFCANYGQIDSLVDDESKSNLKYRLISLIAPIVIGCGYISIFFSNAKVETKVIDAVIILIIMFESYFNLKHLIIPDVEFGIVGSIRGYNLLALLLSICCVCEITFSIRPNIIGLIVTTVILCIVFVIILPILERGAKKWTL